MNIRIIRKTFKVNQKYYKLLVFIFTVFITLSCKSQNAKCEYIAEYDTITNKNVFSLVDTMPVFLGKEGDIGRYVAHKYEDTTKVGFQLN